MYKIFYDSSKAQTFTLLESSLFAIKTFGSCLVYFGLLFGVPFYSSIFFVVLGKTI